MIQSLVRSLSRIQFYRTGKNTDIYISISEIYCNQSHSANGHSACQMRRMILQLLFILWYSWISVYCHFNLYDTLGRDSLDYDYLCYHIQDEKLVYQQLSDVPRSKNPVRTRSVREYSGHFMEAIFLTTDPMTGFSEFYPEPIGACRKRQSDTVTGFFSRILNILREFPTGKQQISYRFSSEISGILLQESWSWVGSLFNVSAIILSISSFFSNVLLLEYSMNLLIARFASKRTEYLLKSRYHQSNKVSSNLSTLIISGK